MDSTVAELRRTVDMTEAKARQIVLAARPQGRPKPSDFRLEETEIPRQGWADATSCSISIARPVHARPVDNRKSYATPVPLGAVMEGESVATVIASKHAGYL